MEQERCRTSSRGHVNQGCTCRCQSSPHSLAYTLACTRPYSSYAGLDPGFLIARFRAQRHHCFCSRRGLGLQGRGRFGWSAFEMQHALFPFQRRSTPNLASSSTLRTNPNPPSIGGGTLNPKPRVLMDPKPETPKPRIQGTKTLGGL